MTCDEAVVAISALLDRELSEEENLLLQQHLEQCESCRALFAQLQQIESELPELDADVPETLASIVMDRIHFEKARSAHRRFWLVAAAVAAALAVVVLSSIGAIHLPELDMFGRASVSLFDILNP